MLIVDYAICGTVNGEMKSLGFTASTEAVVGRFSSAVLTKKAARTQLSPGARRED